MKLLLYLLLLPFLIFVRKDYGIGAHAQTSSYSIITKEDARDLLDTMNAPSDRATGALVFTLRYNNTPEQRLYIWQNGVPTSDSTASFIAKGYIVRPMRVRAVGDTAWCSGYWTAATLYTDASLVRNLAYRVGLAGFAKYADVLSERSRALAAESALSSQIAAIPAGATGATGIQGIQGVPGTPATPNTASTPLFISGNNLSIQTASGSQPGVISANDWNTFNNKLTKILADTYYMSIGYIPAWTNITGKPTFFDGTWGSLTGKPTTVAGYGITDVSKTTTDIAEGINQYFTQARARASLTGLPNGGITINSATGEVSQTTPIYNNAPGRALNTSFRPSTVRPTRVSYTVSIATTLSLLNLNSSGVVDLQISADNVNWVTINSAGVTRTLAVSISVGLNDTTKVNVGGEIPTGYYGRAVTTTSGGATVTMSSGQEVTY